MAAEPLASDLTWPAEEAGDALQACIEIIHRAAEHMEVKAKNSNGRKVNWQPGYVGGRKSVRSSKQRNTVNVRYLKGLIIQNT